MKTSWLDRWWFATDQSQDVAPRLDGGGLLSYAMAPMALRYPVLVRRLMLHSFGSTCEPSAGSLSPAKALCARPAAREPARIARSAQFCVCVRPRRARISFRKLRSSAQSPAPASGGPIAASLALAIGEIAVVHPWWAEIDGGAARIPR